ncbi:bud site selection protein 27 [Monosporozyma servazzii]
MDVQVDVLISSVEKSLASLENKRDFLEEQKVQYSTIHDRLITFKAELSSHNDDDDDDDAAAEQKGLIMGDVIISSNKCFLNVGYEYYVEKPCDEIIDFVDDKLNLMVEALEQFNLKIKEAEQTLDNLKQVGAKEKIIDETEILKSGTIDDALLTDFDTEFPTMEIREELDEDGNVINSTIKPTREVATKKSEVVDKPTLEEGKHSDFESNLKGKLLPHQETPAEEEKTFETPESQHNKVDTENIYSFADLVQQIDDEDGEFDEEDVEYDYERFNNHMENLNINDDEEYEDEEYEDDGIFNGYMNMVPGTSGQSSFMDQITKLRAQRNGVIEEDVEEPENKKEMKPIKKSAEIEIDTKPILKQESDFSEEAEIKKQEEKKKGKNNKKKKSVGFATQLDIHEVESFKEETKKQTHRMFPTAQQLMFSNLVGVKDEDMVDDTNNPKLHEFDSDLFASMLGVKGPEEIHDKYSQIVEKEVEEEEIKSQEHAAKKKKRVSRFRKDKLAKKPDYSMNQLKTFDDDNTRNAITNDVVEREIIEETGIVSDTILEHDILERDVSENAPVVNNVVEKGPVMSEAIVEKDIVERSPVMSDVVEKVPVVSDIVERSPVMSDVVEKVPVVSDIVERSPVMSDIVEKIPVVSDIVEKVPVVSDIVEQDTTEITTPPVNQTQSKKKISLFNKKFTSLPKPSSNLPTKPPIITQEMLDTYQPEDGDIEEEPKIRELKEGEDGNEIFPTEIKDAIHKMGKTEENMHVANVDYSGLNDNLDDMVKAYSLGLYDDDLEEHPGTVLEKVEDFKSYNQEVESLSDVIKEFKKENPMFEGDMETEEDNKIMTDTILERDIPEDYSDDDNTSKAFLDDYGLNSDNLQESVVFDYHKLKQTILPKLQAEIELQSASHKHSHTHSDPHDHSHSHSAQDGIEPVDSEGNPIRVSKFKSQRLQLNH